MAALPYTIENTSRLRKFTIEHDGINFHAVAISPPENVTVKGTILFIHGWCEHSEMYYRTIETFSNEGYECLVFDQRGSGNTSLGKYRGRIGRTKSKIYTDIDRMLEVACYKNSKCETHDIYDSKLPLILIGHSMGGGIALSYAVHGKYRNAITHVVTTGPMIQMHESLVPSPWVNYLLSTVAHWFPNWTYSTLGGPTTVTTSEPWKEYLNTEVLCQGTGTLGQLSNMISRGADLLFGDLSTINPNVKLLVLHADNDNYTSIKASERFINRVDLPQANKEFVKVENSCHSLFIEDEKIFNRVTGTIKTFLQ